MSDFVLTRKNIVSVERENITYRRSYLKNELTSSFYLTPLGKLYNSLLTPWRAKIEIPFRGDTMRYQTLSENLAAQTGDIINWSYNSRYRPLDGSYIPLTNLLNTKSDVKCFNAYIEIEGEHLILMSISAAYNNNVEALELFNLENASQLLEIGSEFIEIKRFARHPLLDILRFSKYRKESSIFECNVIRKLWLTMFQHINTQQTVPLYILAPHVKLWFDNAGVGPVCLLTDKVNKRSERYNELLKTFPYYWSNKPALYRAPYQPLIV